MTSDGDTSGHLERLRVGNAEREATTHILGTAMADGRLTLSEYEQRVDAVWNSTTRGELARVTDDLPAVIEPELPAESKDSKQWREYLDEWRWWLGGAIIMNGIWGFQSLSEGELQNYWPMWPLGIWALILVASIFMPDDSDDDDDEDEDDEKRDEARDKKDWR